MMARRWPGQALPYPPGGMRASVRRTTGPAVPLTDANFTTATGYPWSSMFVHNQASGGSTDRIGGSIVLSPSGTIEFQQATPYSTTAVQFTDAGNEGLGAASSTVFDVTTGSWVRLMHVFLGALPAATRVVQIKGATVYYRLEYLTNGNLRLGMVDTVAVSRTATSAFNHASQWVTVVYGRNATANIGKIVTNLGSSGDIALTTLGSLTNANNFCDGRIGAAACAASLVLQTGWQTGAAAETILTNAAAVITSYRAAIGA